MKKYRTGGDWAGTEIREIEVARETEKCVYVIELVGKVRKERRRDKVTSFDIIHDSWDEAHAYLTRRAEQKLQSARLALQDAQSKVGNIKGMKKPESAQ